ncbi:MAG: RNA polymerase sigma factor [Bacteroidia bacterium]
MTENPALDQQMVARIQMGDKEALVELYRQYNAMVSQLVLGMGGSADDVDDVFQETLVALWENMRKQEFVLSSKLSTYLYSIAKNQCMRLLDKRKRIQNEDPLSHTRKAEVDSPDKRMDESLIRKALQHLGDLCRSILIMYYYDGFDMKNIAKAHHFTNANVAKSKKYQCLKQLEGMVKKQYNATDFLR